MTRPPLRFVVGAAAIGLTLLAGSPAVGAGPPGSATIAEGVGGGGAVIGGPLAPLRRAWGLTCRSSSPAGNGVCHRLDARGLIAGGITVWYDANRRIEALDVKNPGWRTRRGLAVGDRIPRVRALYGKAAAMRMTRVWTYFEIDKRIGGRMRRTHILGRTKVGDIVGITVSEVLEPRITASRPAGGGLVVTATGMEPLVTDNVQVFFPWARAGDALDLGVIRADRTGRAELREPPGGPFDVQFAQRPAGLVGAVAVRVRLKSPDYSSLVTRAVPTTTGVSVTVPAAPRLSVSPRVAETGALAVSVDGAESGAFYALVARWNCVDGRSQEAELDDPDEALTRGGATRTAALSIQDVASRRRDAGCAGAAANADLPMTVVLLRLAARGPKEALTQADVVLAPPAGP